MFYQKEDRLLVAVDCIIFGFDRTTLKLLLFRRKLIPLKNEWSLIGSFVKENESVNDAADRVLFESTGLRNVFMNQLYTFGRIDRDTGGRVLSIANYALIRLDEQEEHSVKDYEARWFQLDEIPNLILDHNEMVRMAIEKLKENARFHPIGFELLPEKFTIPQLQLLYEGIYSKQLDRRNFRKKILSMNIIEKLDEKDKSGSKKGAFLYRFVPESYERLMKKGFVFEV